MTSDGNLKRTGGDSWRVYIRQGPASLAPMVTDNDDGTYEVMFLALEPGNYSAQVFLDYTLCDGFRDPPEDWFIKGNLVVNRAKIRQKLIDARYILAACPWTLEDAQNAAQTNYKRLLDEFSLAVSEELKV